MGTFTVEIELTTMTCPVCGVVYGVNERVRKTAFDQSGSWYCTNGHVLTYNTTELDRVRAKLAAEERRVANLRDEVNVAYAGKAAVERKLKRVQRGTCPQCNRHFVNV